jgi:uncharacterized protein YjdB
MRKVILTALLCCLFFKIYCQNPIFNLKYDEVNGATTTREEISGNNLTISNQFGKPERVLGVSGNALRTDGFSTWIQTNQNFNITTSMTVQTWVVLESYPSDAEDTPYSGRTPSAFISQYDGSTGFTLSINTYGIWYLAASINGQLFTCYGKGLFPLYSWTHVTATIDGAAGAMKLYLNGSLEASISTPVNGTINKSGAPLIIGKGYRDLNENPFLLNGLNGTFDNTKIYNVALQQSSISSEAAAGASSISTTGEAAIAVSPIRFENDLHRPKYHALPPANWTNEPHGLVYHNGTYHMFYQRTPNGPYKKKMHWGHMSSTDLVDWTNTKDALFPEVNIQGGTSGNDLTGFDMKGIWSGDVVVNNGVAHAFYTCVNFNGPFNPGIAHATSSDPGFKTWTKLGPVINKEFVDDFRDPYLFKEGSTWYMIIGSKVAGAGGLDCYTSTDLNTWTHKSNFCTVPYSSMDIGSEIWEMPVFESMGNNKYILITNPIGGKAGKYGPDDGREKYTRAVYWIGTFVNGQFKPDYNVPKNLDLVHGHLSPTVERSPSGQLVGIGMVDERRDGPSQKNAGWAHLYSLPRTYSLLADGKTLGQAPAPELTTLRNLTSEQKFNNVNVNGTTPLTTTANSNFEIIVNIPTTTAAKYGLNIRVSPDHQEITKIYYDANAKKIVLDKTNSTLAKGSDGEIALDSKVFSSDANPSIGYDEAAFGKPTSFRVFVDNSIAEVFINEKAAFSFRIYPTKTDSRGIELFSEGASTFSVTMWATGVSTTPIPVTGISLNKSNTTIVIGNTETLLGIVAPSNATNKAITWTSSNSNVANVSSNGVVSAVSLGSAVITAKTVDGNFTATCNVTTANPAPPVLVTGVTLDVTSASLFTNGTLMLVPTISPSNATNKNVTWSSSNTAIAVVNTPGIVTAVGPGTATITVTTVDGGKTATCTVTVTAISYLIYDFETGDLNGWTTTGQAFSNLDVTSTASYWGGPFNQHGTYHMWGFNNGGDAQTGEMRTANFVVGGDGKILALIAGGNDVNNLYLGLYRASDNTLIQKATADNSEAYVEKTLDASAFVGVSCYLKAIDNTTAGFGHLNLDYIRIPYQNGVAVTGVTLNKPSTSLIVGASETLTTTITPTNASNTSVTWSSSNTAVATVNTSGVVTAIGAGTANIIATTVDGSKTATCAVTVTALSYLIYDFETGDLNGWTTTGQAFSNLDVTSTASYWGGPFNQHGTYHMWGFNNGGDAQTGEMRTSNFVVGGDGRILVLIAGGNDVNNLYLGLYRASDNTLIQKVIADNSEAYVEKTLDASAFVGVSCYLKAIDNSTAGFGHLNLDYIRIPYQNGVSVTGVTLNKPSTSLTVGASETLTATISPTNASNPSVTWSSSNTAVATVNTSGIITAVGAGTAIITVTTTDGNKNATIAVTVTQLQYLVLDFEVGNLTGWNIFSGSAFSSADVCTDVNWGWGGPFNQQGSWHLWSFKDGSDAQVGELRSQNFTLGGNGQVTFLVGGGSDINNLYVALCRASDNLIIGKQTGSNNEAYSSAAIDGSAYIGSSCYIRVYDNSVGGWGHMNVDNVRVPLSSVGRVGDNTVNENQTVSKFNIYPNPAKDQFVIDLSEFSGTTRMELLDMTGKMLLQKDFEKSGRHSVSMHDLNINPGFYLIRCSHLNTVITKKLVIN